MTLSITFYDHVRYTKDDFMNRDRDFFGNGVVVATDFPLVLTGNLTFTIGSGTAWVDGYRIANDSTPYALNVAAPDAKARWDIVQIGHDDYNSQGVLVVKKGVADGNLIEPGADPNYLKLFAIMVDPGVTQLTADKIVDRRTLVPLKVSGSQIAYDGAVKTSALGQANGVATLDAGKQIPLNQLQNATDQTVRKADAPQFAGLTSTGDVTIKKGVGYLYFDASRTNKSSIRWNASSSTDLGLDINVDGNNVLGLTSDKKATFQGQIESKVTGATTPPLIVASTAKVTSLNADMVDGMHAADFVAATEKGATNGVAQLDAGKKVPIAQLPAGSTNGLATLGADGKLTSTQLPAMNYIPTTSAGAINGVATLDATGKVTSTQLPALQAATTTTLGSVKASSSVQVNASGVMTVTPATIGAAVTSANTFTDTQTAPTFVATSNTAPLQLPNLTALPGTVGPKGTLFVVNNQWYVSDGTNWTAMSSSNSNLPVASATTLGGVKQGSGVTIDGTGKISVAQGAGSGLNADKVQGRDLVASVANLEYDVYGLELQNYYAGKISPAQGMQYDGFSDLSKFDQTNSTLAAAANAGATSVLVPSTATFQAGTSINLIDGSGNSEARTITAVANSSGNLSLTLDAALVGSYSAGAVVTRSSAVLDTTNRQLRGFKSATSTLSANTIGNSGTRSLARMSTGSTWALSRVYTSNTNYLNLYKSLDNGLTWTFHALIYSSAYDISASIAVDVANNLVVAYQYDDTSTTTKITVKKFDASGTQIASSTVNSGGDGYGISTCVDGSGAIHLAWSMKEYSSSPSPNIFYTKSTDGGVTWAANTMISNYNTVEWENTSPTIAVRSNNLPVIAWKTEETAGSGQPLVYKVKAAAFNSSTWTTTTLHAPGANMVSDPSVAVDGTDVIHVVWSAGDTGDTTPNIRYIKSTNGGVTWSAITKLTSETNYAQTDPSLTIDKNNLLYVVFTGVDPAVNTIPQLRKLTYNGSTVNLTTLTSYTNLSATYPSVLWSKFYMNYDSTDPLIMYSEYNSTTFKRNYVQYLTGGGKTYKKSIYHSKKVSYPTSATNAKVWVTRGVTTTTTLSAAKASGSTSLTVASTANFDIGDVVEISAGKNRERLTITAVAGTTWTVSPAIANAYDTTCVIARVDVIPQISLVPTDAAESFSNLTFQRSFANSDGTIEDSYYYSTATAGTDVTVKLQLTTNNQILTPLCSRYGVTLGI